MIRYSYNFQNPKEREMYMQKKLREYERAKDTEKTIQEKYNDIVKERQEELKYFI